MEIYLLVVISMIVFFIGAVGLLTRRNVLIFFLCIELMLNAGNLLFVSFARFWGNETGLIWVFFTLVVAAAEAAAGFAIIINMFRTKQVVDVDQYNELRG
mgnify:CR=1 FL=1